MELEDLIIPITTNVEGVRGGLRDVGMQIRRFGAGLTRAFSGIGVALLNSLEDADNFMRGASGFSEARKKIEDDLAAISLTLGTQLLPVALQVIEGIQGLIDRFQALSPEVQKGIAIFGGVLGVLGILGPVIAAIGTAIGLLSAPILAVIALIAAIGVAIALGIEAVKRWAGVFDLAGIIIRTMFDRASAKIKQAIDYWKSVLQGFRDWVKLLVDKVKQFLGDLFAGMSIPGWLVDLMDFFNNFSGGGGTSTQGGPVGGTSLPSTTSGATLPQSINANIDYNRLAHVLAAELQGVLKP